MFNPSAQSLQLVENAIIVPCDTCVICNVCVACVICNTCVVCNCNTCLCVACVCDTCLVCDGPIY